MFKSYDDPALFADDKMLSIITDLYLLLGCAYGGLPLQCYQFHEVKWCFLAGFA